MRKYKEEDKMKKTFKEETHEVGLLILKSYLHIVLEGGSAADFFKLINYTYMIPDILKSEKNNSRSTFLLRDYFF